jgi:ketosteroid isomerase-like protein
MKHSLARILVVAVGLMTGATLSAPAGAKETATRTERKTQEAIWQVIQDVEAALQSGASAEKLVDMLYAENIMITEEPPVVNLRGTKQAIEGVQGFLDYLGPGGGKGCKYRMVEPTVASKTTFSSYLALNCSANPPAMKDNLDLRMLYVWKKLPQGWRVVLETVQTGMF